MRAEHLKGHLDGLLLAVLERDPKHGYAIIEELRTRTDELVDLPSGTVYPALRRLEAAGLVDSHWAEVGGRRRRTYRLTPRGRRTLADERREWETFVAALDPLLS